MNARLSKVPLASRGGGTGPTGIVWCFLRTAIAAHHAVWFSVSEMVPLAWTREDTYLEMARRQRDSASATWSGFCPAMHITSVQPWPLSFVGHGVAGFGLTQLGSSAQAVCSAMRKPQRLPSWSPQDPQTEDYHNEGDQGER